MIDRLSDDARDGLRGKVAARGADEKHAAGIMVARSSNPRRQHFRGNNMVACAALSRRLSLNVHTLTCRELEIFKGMDAQNPNPPPANSFVIGPAVINTHKSNGVHVYQVPSTKCLHRAAAYMVNSCVCFSSTPTSKPMTILQLVATRLIRRSFAIAAVSSSTANGAPSAWRAPRLWRCVAPPLRLVATSPPLADGPPPHLAADNFRWADFS